MLAKDNGAPISRAYVRLAGVPAITVSAGSKPAYVQREVQTDDNGAFNFADLPPGSYNISVPATNGFLELARARQAVVGQGGALVVSIRLERTGAIVGRITDRNGQGLLSVEVQALRRDDFRGHVTLMPDYASRASTNDLGQFRLFNLTPGEYFVVAVPVHSARDLPTTRRSGFVMTYYPGTQALMDARLVVVRTGKDITNVSFSLASGPLAKVVIDAVDSRGLPLGREASATLNLVSNVHLPSSMRQTSLQEGGQLVFADVPAGHYYLVVSTSHRQEEAAYVDVIVDGDITLNVQTNSGGTVSGRFVVQGPPLDATSNRPFPHVDVTATQPPGKFGPSYAKQPLAHPQGTDKFELTGVRGPMVLHAAMSGALLVSISRGGGEDLAGRPLDFTGTEIIDDLVVVFTREKAEVEVTLTGLREPEDPEVVLVMLFSEDQAQWHAGSVQYTAIQATAEMPVQPAAARGSARGGRVFTFRLGPVVPGRYLIAAVPTPGVMYPTESAILERLRPLAKPVTLLPGEAVKVEVRVSR
ncbi:MAG: carboxypeptidase-like regulatory domain-containing protein [Vicinamibacterales bacterium]